MAYRPDRRICGLGLVALAFGGAVAAAPSSDSLATAAEALARGDGIAAEVAAREALEAGAKPTEVAALIGEAELIQGDLVDARRWLAVADFSASTRERGFHALARLEMQEGNLAAAGEAFDRALRAGDGNARLWVDIGRLRYLAGQHHSVLDASTRALSLDPDDPRALEFRAQLVRDAQGASAALPLLEHALEAVPDDLGLLGEYAATLGEVGRHRDMLRIARRMVEIDPRHPRPYYLQAVLAARAGLDDLARRLMARTQGEYDTAPAGLMLTGILELRAGNAALAVGRFDELGRRQPDNAMARLLLGRALLANGEANEVVARLGPAADRADASEYLLALVGRAHEQLGRRQEAARYLDRAAAARVAPIAVLATDGGTSAAAAAVSEIRGLLAQGRNAEALNRAGALRTQFPGSIDVDVLSGDVFLLAGDPQAAIAAYERAAEVRRDFALVERMVAAQRALRREDAALQTLAGYAARNPRSAAASAMLGRMLAENGDRERALPMLAYARDLRPGDAALLADLAELELAGGDAASAAETAREAYRLHRANGAVAATLARVLAASEGGGRAARSLTAKARTSSTALARR